MSYTQVILVFYMYEQSSLVEGQLPNKRMHHAISNTVHELLKFVSGCKVATTIYSLLHECIIYIPDFISVSTPIFTINKCIIKHQNISLEKLGNGMPFTVCGLITIRIS